MKLNLLLLFSLFLLGAGEKVDQNNHANVPLPAVRSVSKLSMLPHSFATEIEEDEAGSHSLRYIAPNELYGGLFEKCLSGPKGALVSVGTFRGLNLAASGKISHLVLFDYDEAVRLFNLVNVQLIRLARDRFEYLSYLFSGIKNEKLTDEVRAGKISLLEFVRQLARDPQRKGDRVSIAGRWRALGVQLPKGSDWQDLQQAAFKKGKPTEFIDEIVSDDLVERVNRYLTYEGSGGLGRTIFWSDSRFNTIKQMVDNNRVVVMVGDLVGDKGMKTLGEAFRSKGITVSAVDISNVPDYLLPEKKNPVKNKFQKLKENLLSLPLSDGAKVFMTSMVGSIFPKKWQGKKTDGFRYFALSKGDLEQVDAVFKAIDPESQVKPLMQYEARLLNHFKPDPADDSNLDKLFTSPSHRCL